MRLEQYPVIVVLWGLDGCPACAAYIPLFRKLAAEHAGCFPTAVIDTSQPDVAIAADKLQIRQLPVTTLFRHGQVTARRTGAQGEADLRHIFALAHLGRECKAAGGDDVAE